MERFRLRHIRLLDPTEFLVYAGLTVAVIVLSANALSFALHAWHSAFYPFSLDYGEGIVWQQALLIVGDEAYGDLNTYPFLVFHYPPLYHFAVRIAAVVVDDYLVAGRLVSLLATFAAAAGVALLVFDSTKELGHRGHAVLASTIAGLSLLSFEPVFSWSPYMRVDMLGLGFTVGGIFLAMKSVRKPRWMYAAFLLFVAAAFTKQTFVAAPLSVFCVFLVVSPRQVFRAALLAVGVGTTALLVASWATGGGFLQHLVMYNVNRFDVGRGVALVSERTLIHSLYLVTLLAFLATLFRRMRSGGRLRSRLDVFREMRTHAQLRFMSFSVVYLAITSLMLVMTGKSGSNVNYLIEWMLAWSLILGTATATCLESLKVRDLNVSRWFVVGVPMAIACQGLFLLALNPALHSLPEEVDTQASARIVELIRQSEKPVLSEDMVLLLRAGKEVPAEPAIIAELASVGVWDERLLTELFASDFFGFVVTEQMTRGEMSRRRYTPAILAALEAAYPRIVEFGRYRLHLPAPGATPSPTY